MNPDPIGQGGGVNVYEYCFGNPILRFDFSGFKPGDDYHSMDAAGKAAIRDVYPQVYDWNVEEAGVIYRKRNGRFTYTDPRDTRNSGMQSYTGPAPADAKALGCWHTHAKGEPYSDPGRGIYIDPGDNDFSPNDKGICEKSSTFGYVGVPNGTIRKYTPLCVPYFGVVPGKGRDVIIGRWR